MKSNNKNNNSKTDARGFAVGNSSSNKNNNSSNNGDNSSSNCAGKKSRPVPMHEIAHVRLVANSDMQENIASGSAVNFSEVAADLGDFLKFVPGTSNILLRDNAIYFVIYESQISSVCNSPLSDLQENIGLHLDLDGEHVSGSGASTTVFNNNSALVSSHAIITTHKDQPNVLRLLNLSDSAINSYGANLTIIRIGKVRPEDEEKTDC